MNTENETNKEILVEETETFDSVKTEVKDVVFEEPVSKMELLVEETPVVPQKPRIKKEKSRTDVVEEIVEQPVLAEVTPTKPEDTANPSTLNSQLNIAPSVESSGASTWCATNVRKNPNSSPNLSWKTEPCLVSRKTRT